MSRPSRSMSMNIPSRSSTTLPPIDDVLSMPFSASPLPIAHPRLPSISPAPLPTAPTSSVPRHALPYVLPHHHRPAPTVIPRIIRASNATGNPSAGSASGPSTSWADVACSPPTSPRTRRPSAGAGSNSVSLRPPTLHSARAPATSSHWRPHAVHPHAPVQPQPFPPPAYLDHSALRHLLQTELPPHLHQQIQAPLPPAHVRLVTPASDSDEDRSPSPPVRRYSATAPASSSARPEAPVGTSNILRLPTRWSEQDRHPYLSVSPDGRELTNNGNAAVDNVGLARANHPIPPACGIYYYEIEVLSKGQKSHVSIGFTTSENRLNKLPGWDKNSWGYHSDDGHSFAAEKTGMTYGPMFGGGDVVGAGIDFSQNRAFFTKNGALIGYVFENIGLPSIALYPSVGLRYAHESIRANFGQQPFRFDIDEHVQGQRDAVWAGIQRGPINWRVLAPNRDSKTETDDESAIEEDREPGMGLGELGREAMGKLVLGYLIHHGYAKTAQAFEKQLVAPTPASPALPVPPPGESVPTISPLDMPDSPMADAGAESLDVTTVADPSPSESLFTAGNTTALERRLVVLGSIQAGDLDGALEQTSAWFPDVLARDEGLIRLKMRCRKFVELVNGAGETKRRVEVVRAGKERETETAVAGVDVDGMDVDDGAMGPGADDSKSAAEAALRAAITYGQKLRAEYKRDGRKEVQALLERTFGVVAYHFPMEARGEVGRWAGREGREALAAEVNEAILESQGYPPHPALERMYRQAGATVLQLGHLGVGAAVFADARRELLEA